MKVAILVAGLPPRHTGGSEVAALQLAHHAAAAGHDVHVLAASNRVYRASIDGFMVHESRTLPVRYIYGLSWLPSAVWQLASISPDLVYIQGSYSALPAVVAKRTMGIPYLYSERGSVYVPSRLNKPLYRLILHHADRIVAQTEHQAATLRQYTKKPIEVIPNGVDVSRFGAIPQHQARVDLNLPLDDAIVIAVGRCRPEKHLSRFVDVALMDNQNEYVMVGDGPELPTLIKQAKGCVRFAGLVENSKVPAYLAAADVFVNTSDSEGFPVAVLEAMAAGLPIVAPNVCGLPEIVQERVNGILTVPGDNLAILNAIRLLLKGGQWTEAMKRANKQKAGQYTWQNVANKLFG